MSDQGILQKVEGKRFIQKHSFVHYSCSLVFHFVRNAHPFPLSCVCLGVSLPLEFLMDDDKIGEDFEKFATDNCDIFEDTEVSLFVLFVCLLCLLCLFVCTDPDPLIRLDRLELCYDCGVCIRMCWPSTRAAPPPLCSLLFSFSQSDVTCKLHSSFFAVFLFFSRFSHATYRKTN